MDTHKTTTAKPTGFQKTSERVLAKWRKKALNKPNRHTRK